MLFNTGDSGEASSYYSEEELRITSEITHIDKQLHSKRNKNESKYNNVFKEKQRDDELFTKNKWQPSKNKDNGNI